MKLIVGNKIWKDIGYEESMANSTRGNDGVNFHQMLRGNFISIEEICNSIVLLWS